MRVGPPPHSVFASCSVAERGVNGFGHFCRNKVARLPGRDQALLPSKHPNHLGSKKKLGSYNPSLPPIFLLPSSPSIPRQTAGIYLIVLIEWTRVHSGDNMKRSHRPTIRRSATRAKPQIDRRTVRPTPAGWPQGGTLLASSGPCVSPASWSALLPVSVPPLLKEARRGVNGFGSFCRNKRTSSYGGETPASKKTLNH